MMYAGTVTAGLANIEVSAGTINAIAVLIASIGSLVYAITRAIHLVQHMRTQQPLDDPEQPRQIRDYDRDIQARESDINKPLERSAKQ
jgi:hypothetical protein